VISKQEILNWLHQYREVLAENKDYLTELDSAIGDADHGINMDRGFGAVEKKLPTVEDKDIGTILKTVGMTLVSTVGGAGGPLYGTFFLKAGMALSGKDELTADDMVAAFAAAIDGVKMRGKATTGEKTMLDALVPALEAMRQNVAENGDIHAALVAAADAAEEGVKATIPMLATKGRASYLGERSIGHQDPGATSSWLMLKTAAETIGVS
jgi:dihydroxyacetone kinase-like protein